MATPANAGRTAAPRHMKLLTGRSEGRDSGGRVVPAAPGFERGAPKKPRGLSKDAAWLWDRIVDQMEGPGILKPLDGPSMEVVCETFARWREAVRMRQEKSLTHENSQGETAGPWIGIEERASREFRAWCSEYGLTPAAERHLASDNPTPDPDNPFQ